MKDFEKSRISFGITIGAMVIYVILQIKQKNYMRFSRKYANDESKINTSAVILHDIG